MGRQGSPRWCGKRFAWLRSPGPPKGDWSTCCTSGPVWTSQVYNQKILYTWNMRLNLISWSWNAEVFLRYFVGIAASQYKSSWFILKLSARVAVCFSSAPFANAEREFVAHPGTANWPLSGLWFFPFLWDATKIENLTFLILRVKVFGRSCNETAPCLSEASLEQIVNVYNT